MAANGPESTFPETGAFRKQPKGSSMHLRNNVPAQSPSAIKWKPQLPPEQADAARQLQYSRIMKTAVWFNSRFWTSPKRSGFRFHDSHFRFLF
jgi:hypothetical protein